MNSFLVIPNKVATSLRPPSPSYSSMTPPKSKTMALIFLDINNINYYKLLRPTNPIDYLEPTFQLAEILLGKYGVVHRCILERSLEQS